MHKLLAIITLAASFHVSSAQIPAAVPSTVPAGVRSELTKLKPGNQATITLSTGKKLKGEVRELNQDSVNLRVNRGFFRYRTETVPYCSMVDIKKNMPTWVGPTIALGALAGVLIGVSACVASGACLN